MKIGRRLIVTCVAISLVGLSALGTIIFNISQNQIDTFVRREINNLAGKEGREIQIWLEAYLETARTIAQIMHHFEDMSVADRRPLLNSFLKDTAASMPGLVAVWSIWEPDILDGMDASFVNTTGSDESGRFLSYWVRSENGPVLETLKDYAVPGGWYSRLSALKEGHEVITDPYYYPVHGELRLVTTLACPVMKDGKLVGNIGIDIENSVIESRVEKIKPYRGSMAAVYTNGGIVGAHSDPGRVGRSMLIVESDLAGKNLKRLNEAVAEGKPFSFFSKKGGGKGMNYIAVPFTIGKTGTPWSLMVGIPESVVIEPVYRMLRIGGFICGIIVILIFAAAAVNAAMISVPLRTMMDVFEKFSYGKEIENKSLRTISTRKDEIGQLGRVFYSIYLSMRELIVKMSLLNNSIRRGLFLTRMDPSVFSGNFRRIITSVNAAMDIVCHQLDSIPDALAIFSANRQLLYCNSTMEEFLARHDLSKRDPHLLDQLASKSEISPLMAEIFNENAAAAPRCSGAVSLDERNYTLSLSRTGDINAGEPLSVMLLVSDVTALSKARYEAEAANRAKSEFLSRMSHELRTPLNAITGMATIAENSSDRAVTENCLARIHGSSRQLLEIIDDILEYEKIEKGSITMDCKEFSLSGNLAVVEAMFDSKAKSKNIRVKVNKENIIHDRICADSLRINQVLSNLMSNAVKFSPEGSEIVLTVSETESVNSADNAVYYFEVLDHGIGINPEKATHLWKPFEQGDGGISRSYGGTGLGLAISKNLVKLMGGETGFRSVEGEGSTFYFSIPCATAASTDESGLRPPDLRAFEGRRCLIVDDLDINREIVMAILSQTPLALEEASDGREAVEKFGNSEVGYYDAILMDIQMPGLDGCSATRMIRSMDRADAGSIPIIAVSANVMKDDIKLVMESGMNAHLGKPLDSEKLISVLRDSIPARYSFRNNL